MVTASGVAQIQQLIAKWREMAKVNDRTPEWHPHMAEDLKHMSAGQAYARRECADELEAALLAVDAPPCTDAGSATFKTSMISSSTSGNLSDSACTSHQELGAVAAPPPQAEEREPEPGTGYDHWRGMAADTVNHFWFTNRESGVLLAEIDRLRGRVNTLLLRPTRQEGS